MKINIAIQLDYDDDFGEFSDFQYSLKEEIKKTIIDSVKYNVKIKDFIENKVNKVLEEFDGSKD